MKALRNLMLVAVVVGTMAMMSARSFAGPLLPDFPSDWWLTNPWKAGQSKLVNPLNPTEDYIHIDWIVFWDEAGIWGYPGSFVYLYQIENTRGSSGVRGFTVWYGDGVTEEIGTKEGDLDADNPPSWLGHYWDPNFPNLATETEPGGIPLGDLTNYNASFVVGGVSWTNNLDGGITLTNESLVLYLIDPRPPTYGTATAHDAASWWGQVTLGAITYGDPVPVPSPEPAAIFLMLSAIGALWRRRKN